MLRNLRGLFFRILRRPPGESLSVDTLREVCRLELRTQGLVDSLFSGEYSSIFHGRGLEFSHVRKYQHGDDVRAIDWKVTARRGTPFVRMFVEDRDLLVALVVDVSGSGRLGPGERSAGEVAAEIAAALAFAANRNNDRICLLLVSDRVECAQRVSVVKRARLAHGAARLQGGQVFSGADDDRCGHSLRV